MLKKKKSDVSIKEYLEKALLRKGKDTGKNTVIDTYLASFFYKNRKK